MNAATLLFTIVAAVAGVATLVLAAIWRAADKAAAKNAAQARPTLRLRPPEKRREGWKLEIGNVGDVPFQTEAVWILAADGKKLDISVWTWPDDMIPVRETVMERTGKCIPIPEWACEHLRAHPDSVLRIRLFGGGVFEVPAALACKPDPAPARRVGEHDQRA